MAGIDGHGPAGGRMSTRTLVEGALLTAITILFCVLDAYIPIFALVYPLPVVVLVVRRGVRAGVLATVIAVLGTSALAGPLQGLTVLAKVGIVGITLGACLNRRLSAARTIIITGVAVVVSVGLTLAVSILVFDFNLGQLTQAIEEGLRRSIDIYRAMGLSQKDLAMLEQSLRQLVDIMKVTLPAAIFLAIAMVSFINFAVARLVLKRLGHEVASLPRFSHWRVPWYWGWGYIAGGVVMLLGQGYKLDLAFKVGLNIMTIFSYVFLVQGLALAWFFMDKYRVSTPVRVLLVFFMVITRFLSQLVVWLGLFDAWLDLRKLARK
ncbi:MAG TPA: YybS family protein [Firmicutes bacterium]|nr:YybS family protein [Bacillota bacterium]